MKKDHRENTVGPWAKQKLDALESYLVAYMNVMKNQRFRLVFVDAFAGSGTAKVRQVNGPLDAYPSFLDDEDIAAEDEFIRGSPRRALELQRPFHRHFFFDMDPRRGALLEQLAAEYPDRSVKVTVGEANASVQDLASKFQAWDLRGVAFLDPYGAHLQWKTLEALAATGKFDVIINFPLDMAINRLIKRDGDIPDNSRRQLNDCFGCEDWHSLAFDRQSGLFGDEMFKRGDAGQRLLGFYVERLRGLFGSVAGPSLVSNTKGAGLYHLIWASSNPRGKPIAKHILDLGSKVTVPRK